MVRPPYNYNALNIGLVILAFGIGNIVGSIIGGRLSDRYLRRVRKRNGGINVPEVNPYYLLSGAKLIEISLALKVPSLPCHSWWHRSLRTPGQPVNTSTSLESPSVYSSVDSQSCESPFVSWPESPLDDTAG